MLESSLRSSWRDWPLAPSHWACSLSNRLSFSIKSLSVSALLWQLMDCIPSELMHARLVLLQWRQFRPQNDQRLRPFAFLQEFEVLLLSYPEGHFGPVRARHERQALPPHRGPARRGPVDDGSICRRMRVVLAEQQQLLGLVPLAVEHGAAKAATLGPSRVKRSS